MSLERPDSSAEGPFHGNLTVGTELGAELGAELGTELAARPRD
jgi:hypothetical protein